MATKIYYLPLTEKQIREQYKTNFKRVGDINTERKNGNTENRQTANCLTKINNKIKSLLMEDMLEERNERI